MSWKAPTGNKKFFIEDPLAMSSSSNLVSLFNNSINNASWSTVGGDEDKSSDLEDDALLLLTYSSSSVDSSGTLQQSEIKKGRTRTSDRRRSFNTSDRRRSFTKTRASQSTKSSEVVRRRQSESSLELPRSHKPRRSSIQKELSSSRLRAPSLSPTAKSQKKKAVHSKTNTLKKKESSCSFKSDSSNSDDDDDAGSCASDDDSDSSGSRSCTSANNNNEGGDKTMMQFDPLAKSGTLEFGFNSTTCHFCHKDVGPMVMQCMSCKEAYFCQKCMHKGWWKPHQQECAPRKVDEKERNLQERKVVKAHKSMPDLIRSSTPVIGGRAKCNSPRKSSSLKIGKFFGLLGKGKNSKDGGEEDRDNSNSDDDNTSITSSNNNSGTSSSKNRRRLFRRPSRANQHQMLDGDDSSME